MMGAVVHTLNLRLHPTEIGYIARHAEDSVVLVDRSLLPLLDQFVETVPSVRHVIVMADDGPTPEGKLDYEQLLAAEPAEYDWPRLDENAAATICYTSGTTGNPKGVVYSHRSNVLHALIVVPARRRRTSRRATPSCPSCRCSTRTAGGSPHSAAAVGAKLVFPGPKLDPESLLDLMASEKVTIAAGVPTIWLGILALLDAHPKKWDLSRLRQMVVGGSAAPPAMIEGFEKRHGLTVVHAWGMTETNPLGSVARVKQSLDTGDRRVAAVVPRVAGLRGAVRRDAALATTGPRARRGTARRWASSRSAGPGSPRRTSATRARTDGPPTGGSRPATS